MRGQSVDNTTPKPLNINVGPFYPEDSIFHESANPTSTVQNNLAQIAGPTTSDYTPQNTTTQDPNQHSTLLGNTININQKPTDIGEEASQRRESQVSLEKSDKNEH